MAKTGIGCFDLAGGNVHLKLIMKDVFFYAEAAKEMRGTISVPNGLARLADSSKFARKGTTVAVTVELAVVTWRIADNFK